jgi:hypothetical protein
MDWVVNNDKILITDEIRVAIDNVQINKFSYENNKKYKFYFHNKCIITYI